MSLSKLRAIALCLGLVLAATVAPAQDRRVTLPGREITLRELFGQIRRQTAQSVMFDADNTALDKRVTLPAASGTVAELLAAALPAEGLGWKVVESYILISPERAVARQAPAPAREAVEPIRINESDLRTFTERPGRGPDSVYYRTVERGPFEFKAAETRLALSEVVAVSEESPRRLSSLVLKTNLLHGAAALTPNLYGEAGLGRRTTFEAGVVYNGWNLNGTEGDNRKQIHGGAIGEFRYWTCERFNGHFFGVHGFGGFYNVGGHDLPFVDFKRDFRYEGTTFGGGVSWGYALPIAPRWNLEFNLGVGVAYMQYDTYDCDKCSDRIDTIDKVYFGPTRAGISLTFIIK